MPGARHVTLIGGSGWSFLQWKPNNSVFKWKWKYFILNYLYKMIPAFTYENNSWDFYLWISQELHFQTMWSILNTPYGLCTLRTTLDWKKKKLWKHKPPSSKVPAGTSVPHKCSFLFMFLTPTHIHVCSWNLHPCLLKIPWATSSWEWDFATFVWVSIQAGQVGWPALQAEGHQENAWARIFSPAALEMCSSAVPFPQGPTCCFCRCHPI